MGRFAEAEPLFREVLETLRVAVGKSHPHYASSLNGLAALYQGMGTISAESLFREAMTLRRVALGESHPEFAQSLCNLASVYEQQGKVVEARRL